MAEATVDDALDVLGGCRPVIKCVRCGTKGHPRDVFCVVDTGSEDNPNSAIPVKAGKIISKAWSCKICRKE